MKIDVGWYCYLDDESAFRYFMICLWICICICMIICRRIYIHVQVYGTFFKFLHFGGFWMKNNPLDPQRPGAFSGTWRPDRWCLNQPYDFWKSLPFQWSNSNGPKKRNPPSDRHKQHELHLPRSSKGDASRGVLRQKFHQLIGSRYLFLPSKNNSWRKEVKITQKQLLKSGKSEQFLHICEIP